MISLDRLEQLARAATPGPWWRDGADIRAESCTVARAWSDAADADYLAAANPAAILELVARVRELEAAVDPFARVPMSHTETGWLIERIGSPAMWWVRCTGFAHQNDWTADASKALRFSRQQDAETILKSHFWNVPGLLVTEHTWHVTDRKLVTP